MKKIIIITLLLLLSTVCQSLGQPPVVIAVDDGNPPFMFKIGNKAAGLYPTLIKTVFKRMQVPVVIRALPWGNAIKYADEGKIGIAGIYKNPHREKKYDYSDELFQERLVLFVLKENKFPYNSLLDLKEKKIGVIQGWSYGEEFDTYRKNGLFVVSEEKKDHHNFFMLLLKKIDCVIAIQESGQSLLSKDRFKEEIIHLNPHIAINPTYLIFPKQAHQTALLSQFNTTVNEIKDNGEYDKLIHQFFSAIK